MSTNLSYQFTNESQETVIWPKRVQILVDDYLTQGRKVDKNIRMDYRPETVDYLEKIFEDRVRDKPQTLKTTINAVYRVRTSRADEFYYYAANKTCDNALGQPVEPFSYEHYGFHKSPIVRLQWNEQRAINEPRVVGYTSSYELKWNKQEVKKLLDDSFIPCENFYVGRAGQNANEPIESHRYQIRNQTDFVDGSFEDLMGLGQFGLSQEYESLYLLEPAREAHRESRKKEAQRKIREQATDSNISS